MFTHSIARVGKGLLSVLVLLLFAGLSACGQSGQASTSQNTPIRVGFSISLGGDFAADGKALELGYHLWADAVNKRGGLLGRKIELVSYDDGSDPQKVTTLYQKLISSDKVDLVLGPFSTLLNSTVAPVVDRYGYALITGAATGEKMFTSHFKDVFSVSPPSKVYLGTFGQYLLSLPTDQRPQTAAYVTVDDPFAVPQVLYGKQTLSTGSVQTVFDNTSTPFPEETTDVTPMVKQIIAKKAEIVILGSTGVDMSVAFIKAFKQQHYQPKAFIATSGPDEGKAFTDAIGVTTAEGVFVPNAGWYPGIKNYQNEQFEADFLAKNPGSTTEDVNNGTVQGYAAGQVLEQAVTKAGTLDQAKLMTALRAGTFQTLQGPVKFDQDGRNTLGVPFLFQWQSGKLLPVYPASQAEAKPEYPKPAW